MLFWIHFAIPLYPLFFPLLLLFLNELTWFCVAYESFMDMSAETVTRSLISGVPLWLSFSFLDPVFNIGDLVRHFNFDEISVNRPTILVWVNLIYSVPNSP